MRGASTQEAKQALRSAGLARRAALAEADCQLLSRAIQARVLQWHCYLTCRSVALYSAIQNEVGTDDLLAHALKSGKKVFYPRVGKDDSAGFFRVLAADELRAGRFGILEPAGTTRLAGVEFEALTIFVPGVAFDLQGNRLGRGRGWYDRLLQQAGERAAIVALAYEFQIVDAVPTGPGDQKVNYVITEKRVVDCGTASAQLSRIF
ncbi:MAG: 5-formyltetrahydrofolate cyclo-ligase [Deltaproteobacteria bacterium]|nr:5-formyltetrahydrofolate cyclo-ligase [Deltaproteobacteria bacterium]MBI2232056.1 5-formyltetrahydrofolate cyclo-ligase [Deltaproteobacteria bacterium]MBI2533669.1 5-formyltetrahydrofolate cyclo-ligase [Deltaproteobacteria bacterium]